MKTRMIGGQTRLVAAEALIDLLNGQGQAETHSSTAHVEKLPLLHLCIIRRGI